MIMTYFTERPYRDVSEDEVLKNQAFFGLSNRFFDREAGARLYNEYLDEAVFAEEMGYDAVMLNEHHGTPFCMGAVMNVEASVLARITKKLRIALMGNPLPTLRNPLRVAEELAMIDCISHGRLLSGWVRGHGSEQIFASANPAYNREYFQEAHDLILQAWTRPGPFRWEGRHFTYRFINPWVLPYQKPHPPILIPGLLSPETAVWSARHRYPYLGLGTSLPETAELWRAYGEAAAEAGYQAGPENFGYLQHVIVTDNETKAEALGRAMLYGGGMAGFARPEHTLPPGYNSREATRRLARSLASGIASGGVFNSTAEALGVRRSGADRPDTQEQLRHGEISIEQARAAVQATYPAAIKGLGIIAGTPKTVIPRLRRVLGVVRPGIFATFQSQGPVSFADRMNSIRLLGQEVLPALREFGKELGLVDPYERTPGSRPYIPGTQLEQLADTDVLSRPL